MDAFINHHMRDMQFNNNPEALGEVVERSSDELEDDSIDKRGEAKEQNHEETRGRKAGVIYKCTFCFKEIGVWSKLEEHWERSHRKQKKY